MKKFMCLVLVFSLSVVLCGCWDYVGLDAIGIVAGEAIDKNEKTDGYKLTFELVDSSGSKDEGPKSLVIESECVTLFDAIRKAKQLYRDKLYHANAQIIVISSQIAGEDGIGPIVDFYMRDAEPRETLNLVISQQETAAEILTHAEEGKAPMSYELYEIMTQDQAVTGTTRNIKLYEVYNILRGQGESLVLPCFIVASAHGKPHHKLNGVAVFKKDYLIGFLTPEETKFYLFAVNDILGGIIYYNLTDGRKDYVSLEIDKTKTELSHSFENNKLKVKLKVNTTVALGETTVYVDVEEPEILERIKTQGEAYMKKQITDIVHKVQLEFNSDIFGFGKLIYQKDPLLWYQLRDNWDAWFPTIEVEVIPEISIVNTGLLKSN